MTASSLFWVLLGGGIGAVGRFVISALAASASADPNRFPWATLFINIAGSFGIGLLWALGHQQSWFEHWGRYLLVTGMLGGFTTFSAFSFETVALIEAGRLLPALGYAFASVLVCVTAAWLGLRVGGY